MLALSISEWMSPSSGAFSTLQQEHAKTCEVFKCLLWLHAIYVLITGPPVILNPPKDTILNMHQDAKLNCQAVADPPNMTYVWQRNGEDIYHIE